MKDEKIHIHGNKPEKIHKDFRNKEWGMEEWVCNIREEDLCFKKLYLKEGCKFSLHMHVDKFEVLFLERGKCVLHWVDTKNGSEQSVDMEIGQPYKMPRFVPHTIEAMEDSDVFEISTFHRDTDSHRWYK